MKIAVFGGAFNPVHIGHTELVRLFDEKLHFDKILIIPSKISPHKSSDGLIDADYRMNMCRIAFSQMKNAVVSDIELRREGISYTVDTLRELKAMYPNDELYLICGSDMFLTLHKWREPNEIIKTATICAAKRGDERDEAILVQNERLCGMGAKTALINSYIPDVSSTDIREKLLDGKACGEQLDERVLCYIRRFGLYLDEGGQTAAFNAVIDEYDRLIEERENRKRYIHSKNVAKKAEELAEKFGCDKRRAYIAGLLHDICKNETDENNLKLVEEFGIMVDDISRRERKLWHAIAGAAYIRYVLQLDDYDIINAVRYHTTGRAGASTLEKIIYLADFISDERDFDGVEKIRKSVDGGLDNAMYTAVRFTIQDLAAAGRPIHPDSVAAYNEALARKPKTN